MLRLAYGCLPSLMSLYFANYLIRRAGVVPHCIVLSAGGLRFRKRRYPTSLALPVLLWHFGPRFTSYLALSGLGASLSSLRTPGRRHSERDRLLSFDELAKTYQVELLWSEDFSGSTTVAQLRAREIELFATCMCDQILRAPLLTLPRAGCVNVHASLLPEFRGVDSIFQAMLHDADEIGVTLHRTTARIDCGDVFGQLAFAREPSDSHLLLLAKAAAAGALVLRRHYGALVLGASPMGHPVEPAAAQHPYRSWPTPRELAQFRRKGLALWRPRDLARIVRFDDPLDPTIAARSDVEQGPFVSPRIPA